MQRQDSPIVYRPRVESDDPILSLHRWLAVVECLNQAHDDVTVEAITLSNLATDWINEPDISYPEYARRVNSVHTFVPYIFQMRSFWHQRRAFIQHTCVLITRGRVYDEFYHEVPPLIWEFVPQFAQELVWSFAGDMTNLLYDYVSRRVHGVDLGGGFYEWQYNQYVRHHQFDDWPSGDGVGKYAFRMFLREIGFRMRDQFPGI